MKTGIAYFSVRSPDYARMDMQEIADMGYTHVAHSLTEFDLEYNQQAVVDLVRMSHECGLGVYLSPSAVGHVFKGLAYSELSARHPGLAQRDSLDQQMVACCPNQESFREYMRKWLEVACSTEAETLLWDEPRFHRVRERPDVWCCMCETCQKLFRKRFGHFMPNSLTERVREFRESSLLEFLAEMTTTARSRGKRNALVLPLPNDNSGLQHWEAAAALEAVDEIGAHPPWELGAPASEVARTYHHYAHELVALAKTYGKEAQIWIKNHSIEHNAEDGVAEATYAAYNEGVRNIFAWAYKGTKDLSLLKCMDWERVWKVQTEAFAECHEKAVMNEMIQALK